MKKYLVLISTNICALALLSLAGFTIYSSVCSNSIKDNSTISCDNNAINKFFTSIGLNNFIAPSAFMISLVNAIFPMLFTSVSSYETRFYDNPSNASVITLARTFLLKIASIYIIIIGYYINGDFANNQTSDKVGDDARWFRYNRPTHHSDSAGNMSLVKTFTNSSGRISCSPWCSRWLVVSSRAWYLARPSTSLP